MSTNSARFSLFKRSNQIYYIGYYTNGKRHWRSTGASTKPEALKSLTQFRELLNERGKSISLEKFFTDFIAFAQANSSARTLSIYAPCLRRFAPIAGNMSVKEVTAEHLDRYKARRLREIKPVTVNIELRALRSVFSTAKRWKLIDSNPFDGVSFAEVSEQAPVFFTVDDFQRLIDSIQEGWLKEVVLFAVLTGMRRGEILNLK